jgi:tRNA-modifying protein YgfZ
MHGVCGTVSLDALGVLRARGQDAVSFLQGQLSNDLTLLSRERSLLAGYHNPQGRVIALLHLLQLASDDLLAILPRELIAPVIARLSKFILRAKVKLADESPQWRIGGLLPSGTEGDSAHRDDSAAADLIAALPAAANATARIAAATVVRLAQEPARWMLVSPVSQPPLPGTRAAAEPITWQRLAVAAGEPQVYAATSEEFVAQMLNLDCLGAIAFDKGCYTGQEVIARAHYRGRVKRRMQRFVTRNAQQLKPADAGALKDGRTFKVVDAVQLPDRRCEFLAVTQLPGAAAAETTPAAGPDGAAPLEAQQLGLPYALPE